MKTAVITGAGRGIGLALTEEFTKHGYNVLATYRDEKSAKELLKFAKANPTVSLVTADVADEKTLGPLQEALKKMKTVDVLINNAGVIGDKGKSLKDLDLKKLSEVLNVNTLGPMRITKLALPHLKKGSVIGQITSLMGSIADNSSGGYHDYRMSKAALNMFNMGLSKELGDVICLALHPGWVQTDMGGAGAAVPTSECAQGLYKVIANSSLKDSGKFLDFRGKNLPW